MTENSTVPTTFRQPGEGIATYVKRVKDKIWGYRSVIGVAWGFPLGCAFDGLGNRNKAALIVTINKANAFWEADEEELVKLFHPIRIEYEYE